MADYNKTDVVAAGHALAELVDACLEDGFKISDDADEVMAFVTALGGAFDDVTGDPKIALMHLLGAGLDHFGDLEQAAGGAE